MWWCHHCGFICSWLVHLKVHLVLRWFTLYSPYTYIWTYIHIHTVYKHIHTYQGCETISILLIYILIFYRTVCFFVNSQTFKAVPHLLITWCEQSWVLTTTTVLLQLNWFKKLNILLRLRCRRCIVTRIESTCMILLYDWGEWTTWCWSSL